MSFRSLLRKPLAYSVAFAALAATAATAGAADVTVTDAKIAGGKLVVSGTTANPNTWVRLDEQEGLDFNVKSGPEGAFSFGVVYHPGDCIVELQKVVSPTTLGAATAALVANCGPAGLTPRGAWSAKTAYSANDLVTHDGSSWRAKRDSSGREPGTAAVWELFAAKGDAADAAEGGAESAEGGAAAAQRVPPTGPAGGDLAGNYPNPQIRLGAITQNDLAANSVNGVKIVDNSVRSSEIRDDTLAGGGLTAVDLGPDSVGSSEIQTDAVQATEIADNSIDSGEIVDNSLFSQDLGASSVRGSELGAIIRRSATSGVIAGNGTGNVGVQCLAGEKVLAGGNDASSAANIVIVASRNDGANGWRVFARNLAAGNQTVTVHAYCLQAS